jgi:hypothetical protein
MRICFAKFGFTVVNPTSPLTNLLCLSLFQLGPLSSVYFNRSLFSTSYDLFLCGGKISTFTNLPLLTTNLGACRRHLAIYEVSPPRVTNASRVTLTSTTSAQDMECSLVLSHTQSLNPTQRFVTKLVQLTKRAWGELAGQRNSFGKLRN